MPTRPPGTPDVDLTFDDTAGTVNGAVFMTGQFQAVPDHFFSFLELRHNGTEQGYNTDGASQFDERDVQNSTHALLLADVPIIIGDGSRGTIEGVAYREFRLNIGEAGAAKQYLSLDALQIWQEESGSLTNFTPGSGFAGTHTNYLAYNLDAGGDHWIGLLEPSNGNGANRTEFTILIPDSDFINDPAHRYVTLYSKFGQHTGWEADSSSEEFGLSVNTLGPTPAMTVHKTATVPGGTADTAGEVISYSITVANVGDVNLTGLTVTDPAISDLAAVLSGGFNVGDVNHDNKLSTGETWQYTGSHTVTQLDLDNFGTTGDGTISNTVTADSNETTPVSATATVEVVQNPTLQIVKTPNVSSVNSAGDQIVYAIDVTNIGSVTLNPPEVTDPQFTVSTPILVQVLGTQPLLTGLLNGDYNVGDINQNGIQDPGETFQFVIVGDENQNGIQDPGEIFTFTNAGDTNQNGIEDPGETFQFANAGDTNQNGIQDPGETFQFIVSDAVPAVDANHDGVNDGDTNFDGLLNVGEIWHFSGTYKVTQDDIDNGGVVDPALKHSNTASVVAGSASGSASADVAIVQNPHLTLTKSASVQDGTANAAGDVINYTITVHNDGNMTLTNPVVSDPSVSNLTLISGDTDSDGKLDVGETWQYSASHTVTQADIDNGGVVDPALAYTNTASVTTDQGAADPDANDSDSASVHIVQDPHVTLTKTALVADGTADAAGDQINYTITVANAGNMTLTNPVVSDPAVSNLTLVSGDNGNGKLDVGETWTYSAQHIVTQGDIDNGGVVDPALAYNNTASVTTDQGAADPDANDSDSASVHLVQNPDFTITKTADVASVSAAGDVINYTVVVDNTGNMTLTGVTLTDSLTTLTLASGDTNSDGKLDTNETWTYTGSYTTQAADFDGSIDNTATVDTAQTDPKSASASVTAPAPQTAGVSIDDINGLSQLVDPGGDGANAGDLIQFFFQITNLGNTTLTSVAVSDTLGDAVPGSLQTPVPTTFAGNATFGDTFNHHITAADISAGFVDDDITVTALDFTSAVQTDTWHYHFLL